MQRVRRSATRPLRDMANSGNHNSGKRRSQLLGFLLFLVVITVIRAIWFGFSVGMIILVLVIYVTLWAVMFGIERSTKH